MIFFNLAGCSVHVYTADCECDTSLPAYVFDGYNKIEQSKIRLKAVIF